MTKFISHFLESRQFEKSTSLTSLVMLTAPLIAAHILLCWLYL